LPRRAAIAVTLAAAPNGGPSSIEIDDAQCVLE
jgi:hypothetical protein